MTAFAYLRKSSVHDPTREVSHQVQEAAVRALAKRHGDNGDSLTILSDWDKSGRLGADKRPGYRALLEAVESGRCTAVYSYSLSRLGRSLPELARLVNDLTERGIPVRLDRDAIDTSTATGKFTAHILMSAAQLESDVASERVRGAIAVKLANGESIGGAPVYGARMGEDAAMVLTAYHQAGSYSGAARLLNQQGIAPRNSKKRMLKKIGGTETDERPVWWPSSVAVVVKRLEPHATRATTRGASGAFALARLLRCPTCGTRLTGTRDRDGRRVRYACRLGSVTPHQRVTVTESHILPAIRAEAERLRTPAEVLVVTDDAGRRVTLEAKRERVEDMYADGTIDKLNRQRRIVAIDAELAALDERQVILAVPPIGEIDWEDAEKVGAVLRAVFTDIALDVATFAPVRFVWTVPEWRA